MVDAVMRRFLLIAGTAVWLGLSQGQAQILQPILNDANHAAASSFTQNVSFRSSSGFVTDGNQTAYEIVGVTNYPHAPLCNGCASSGDAVSIGWDSGGGNPANDSAGLDARIAGHNSVGSGTTGVYRILLPSSGTYNITVALGSIGNTETNKILIRDGVGGTTLATIGPTSTTAANYLAADGNTYANSNTTGLTKTVSVTFTGTTAAFDIGGVAANFGQIQYIGVNR